MANRVGKHMWRKSKLEGSSTTKKSYFFEDQEPTEEYENKEVFQTFLSTEKSLGSTLPFFYPLSLEPFTARKERIVMLAEAFAIFGALFLNGIWFIWEYGSSNDYPSDILRRTFEISCAIDIAATILITLFACFLWMLSIMFSGTQPNFVYGCRYYLSCLMILLITILWSTIVAMSVGVYNRLMGDLGDAIFLVVLISISAVTLFHFHYSLLREQAALEVFHFPVWFRIIYAPWVLLPNQQKLKENAEKRAVTLRSYLNKGGNEKELHDLLQRACHRLGKGHVDVSPFMEKLKRDWYDDVDSLRGRSVDILSKYLPKLLAETVHEMLNEKDGDAADDHNDQNT